jgi:hypothetical protein
MWRLLKLCGLSLLIYLMVFSVVVDRPLSLGVLRLELLQKTARLAALPSPKLVILAGSNGPYSHSCVVLSAMLNMPCENAGIAVGIGLDDIFVRYEPLLHAGDVVYMPMEMQQYTASASAYRAAVDDEFLLRYDRNVLQELPLPRTLGAGFCCTFADLMESLVEMPLAVRGTIRPASLLSTEYDEQGDRIDNELSDRDAALLTQVPRVAPSAQAIGIGYGAALIAGFVARESRKGVIIIGGMPVDYASADISSSVMSVIAATYAANGGVFTVLPNQSQYPRADFFNGEDHLAKPCQYLHSIFVARRLAVLLHKPAVPPQASVLNVAAACPSATGSFTQD